MYAVLVQKTLLRAVHLFSRFGLHQSTEVDAFVRKSTEVITSQQKSDQVNRDD